MTTKQKQQLWNEIVQHIEQNGLFVEFDGYFTTVIKQSDNGTYSFEIFFGDTTEGKTLKSYRMSNVEDLIKCMKNQIQHRLIAEVITKKISSVQSDVLPLTH